MKKLLGALVATLVVSSSLIASQAAEATASCADGGSCVVGDLGPGGGKVFFVSDALFSESGAPCADGCKYLEWAPTSWANGDWGNDYGNHQFNGNNDDVYAGTLPTLGAGFANTQIQASAVLSPAYSPSSDDVAARVVAYRGGGKSDWFIPSLDEAHLISISSVFSSGGFQDNYYWTSTSPLSGNGHFLHSITNTNVRASDAATISGDPGAQPSYRNFPVRPIRAFGPPAVTVSSGSAPNSRLATIPSGFTTVEIAATSSIPKVNLGFTATTSSSTATVAPTSNPASTSATPFTVTGSTKIVDIQVSGITGPVTVCLDGASTDELFHYTGGAWVSLPQRSFANGQVCGVTASFSPFTAAAPVPVVATAPVVQTAPYTGPRISGRVNKVVQTSGSEFTILGDRLSQVNVVSLEGKALPVVSKSDNQIVVKAPAHAAGFVDLLLKADSVALVFQDAFEYKAPAAPRTLATTSKTLVVANAAAKTLTSAQQKLLKSFVASANTGAVLNCQATYVSKADLAIAKALATDACATAKKSNPYLTTKVLASVSVKAKTARTVLLSLTR